MGENLENKDWREEAPTLAGMPVKEVFSVPDGYFDDLGGTISSRIYLEQLKSAEGSDGLQVPADYFEKSKAAILANTSGNPAHKQPSKIVKLWHSKLLKYASAACFVIVAGLGVYYNQENPVQEVNYVEVATEQMLFDIDEDVIIEHIEATAAEQGKVSTDDAALENYILTNFSSADLTTDY